MKTPTFKLRRNDKTEAPDADQASSEPSLGSVLEWTGGAALATKVIRWVLIGCLITAPLALVLAAAGLSSAPAPATSSLAQVDQSEIDERAAVAAFAQDFVVTWLTSTDGQEDALAGFVDGAATIKLPKQAWSATNPATAGIEKTDDSAWTVTVAATVGSQGAPSVRRYFTVPVTYSAGALIALATPAPVAGPDRAAAPRLGYRYRAIPTSPVAIATGEFLRALIAGAGDVTRFISPGADITAITPAPYSAVELEDVLVDDELTDADANPETGRTVHVLVTATASLTKDQAISVAYSLTMTAREGRWEVAAIDASPQVRAAAPTPSGTSSGTPSTSPTTVTPTSPASSEQVPQ